MLLSSVEILNQSTGEKAVFTCSEVGASDMACTLDMPYTEQQLAKRVQRRLV